MRISVFGLGYVGAVSGACLADLGHDVIGVDVSSQKVDMINRGEAPIVEELISELTKKTVADQKFTATLDGEAAVKATDLSLVSVGTPTAANGASDLSYVDLVVRQIGEALRGDKRDHTVVIRSTVPPGTTSGRIAPILEEAAGRKIGQNLNLVFNPEFLREGRSVKDFREPPFTIVGAYNDGGFNAVSALYAKVPAEIIRTEPGVAESIKLLSNAWHGLKVSFANEASRILKAAGVDSQAALDTFVKDTALNISPVYLRPGFAFGGSCLPKDLRAIISAAENYGVSAPVMRAALSSNEAHIDAALSLVRKHGRKPIALFGLAFKPGTDDLRESPYVALAERLIGKGYPLTIVDRHVDASRLLGKNKEFIEQEIPHFVELIEDDAAKACAKAEIIILGHATAGDLEAIQTHARHKTVIDLNGVPAVEKVCAQYEGLGW